MQGGAAREVYVFPAQSGLLRTDILGGLTQKVDGDVADDGHVLGSIALSQSRPVAERDIERSWFIGDLQIKNPLIHKCCKPAIHVKPSSEA